MKKISKLILSVLCFVLIALNLSAQYAPVQHRKPAGGEIPVTEAGSYGVPGATYILMNDITSPRSALFLGKDVTLDLNGYTLTYANGNYQHVPNYGFEEELTGWDISKAPGAKIENAEEVHTFIGKKILRLRAGDEIASGYVSLPVAGRSYYAMCGLTGRYYNEMKGDLKNDMRISIFVNDEQGNEIRCLTRYSDTVMVSCPVINRSARLGGGFVFAHLSDLPAGRYRIRVKADNDCLVDEIDIRPAMDAGIAIVEETHPLGHYDHLYNNRHAAFYDYTADHVSGTPVDGIPVSKGSGSVTIKNGVIKNGTSGVLSWGIQSTAEGIKVIIDNVKITSAGINTTAVDVDQATITRCTFDIDNPFIINRHGSEFYAVDLRGEQSSEVSFSEFHGGQGCLSIKGKNSAVHHNFFANRQTVTNHYSIMAMGDGSRIFENVFKPEIGSGVEIFRKKFIEIFNNEFHINAAPPSCEYADHLSTNAIRLADYGAAAGSPGGSYGNRIYNNRFYINGRKYSRYPDFIPMASAVFYSSSAGDNEIFGNTIFVSQQDPQSDAEAFAFYIGNSNGGCIYNNNIISNVTPIWVASSYGKAENTILAGNTIEKSADAGSDFKPVKLGSDYPATGTEFRSNIFKNHGFSLDANQKPHVYAVYWTLVVNIRDRKGKQADTEVIFHDRTGNEAIRRKSVNGKIILELPEYHVDGESIKTYSPYSLTAGKKKLVTELKQNSEITILIN